MIPLKLRISGFLSYREPVELDFALFDLACISGQNGAGKSSLLDAITWSLFGKARGGDKDALVNLQSKAAEVALTFAYEGNVYRVQRTAPRGKTTALEFQIQDGNDWRPLTEKTGRETQSRIEQTLRLDYDTFVNASFFLQGKADEFTQKKASERKAVLSNILGLEIWEEYKERAANRRKEIERAVDEIDGRLAEINAELDEEKTRKARLKEAEATLQNLTSVRAAQEGLPRRLVLAEIGRDLVPFFQVFARLLPILVRGLDLRRARDEVGVGGAFGLFRRETPCQSRVCRAGAFERGDQCLRGFALFVQDGRGLADLFQRRAAIRGEFREVGLDGGGFALHVAILPFSVLG